MKHSDKRKALLSALEKVDHQVDTCPECGFWKEQAAPLCPLCSDPNREANALCIVRDVNDILAIEKSQAFRGKYHVLGGVLDPLAGVFEKDLRLDPLWKRLRSGSYQEVILALGTSPEAETTAYYIAQALADWPGKVTRLASGVPFGTDLEYTDVLTLARAVRERQPLHT